MLLDIFNSDAFSVTQMTSRVNTMPFVPGRAGRLPIWDEEGVATTSVVVERVDDTLALIPNQPRSTPNYQLSHAKPKVRNFILPHLRLVDAVQPGDVQNVRAFGTDDQLEGVQNVVDKRNRLMLVRHDATVEYQRIGAIKGIILDADGSTTIYNLFTEFGISQPTQDMVLGTSTTEQINVATSIAGQIEDALGEAVFDHIHVFLGKTLWQRFITHATVKTAYQYYVSQNQLHNPLREDLRYRGFEFGGIIWEQYRGKVGSVSFVPDTEGYAFPVGVPGLFKTTYGPADFIETVNTIGLPRYAKQYPTDNRGSSITLETQSNPLSYCTRPEVCIKLTSSN